MRALFGLVVLAFALLIPSAAKAETAPPYGVVTVDLRPEVGDVPTHICVVSEAPGPRTHQKIEELIAKSEANDSRVHPVDTGFFGVDSDQLTCGRDEPCAPSVELPPGRGSQDLYVACTADRLSGEVDSRDFRVLFLMLEHLEGSPPVLEAVKLTGGVVTIGVEADLSRIVVTARSLGGHYIAHGRSFRASEASKSHKLITLPLTPRCEWWKAKVAEGSLNESMRSQIRMRVNGREIDSEQCISSFEGKNQIRFLLPRSTTRGEVSLEITDFARADQSMRFAARWDGAWPAKLLVLERSELTFRWRGPECLHPRSVCPRAVLRGGVECKSEVEQGECAYRCSSGAGAFEQADLQLPIEVHFELDSPQRRWDDSIQRPGQRLTSYVPKDQVYLSADISDWETQTPGNRVSHVEILSPNGDVFRYALASADQLLIQAPQESCAPVRYRFVGDRMYDEGTAQLVDGRILFKSPEEHVRTIGFNLVLAQGGGPAMTLNPPPGVGDPSYFVGLIQLGARFRPRSPRVGRFAFEFRLGGTLGQWSYYGESSLGLEDRDTDRKVPWARLLFEPAMMFDVMPRFVVSTGIAFGASWALISNDRPITRDFPVVVSPSLGLRFKVRDWLIVLFQGRAIFGEKTAVALNVGGGKVEHALYNNISVLGLYGFEIPFQ